MVLGAADAAYESARRVTGWRPSVGGADAGLGLLAMSEVALGVAGPSVHQVPGLGALVVFAFFDALAAPRLRQGSQRIRAAEQSLCAAEKRLRHERIRLRAEARDRASGRRVAPLPRRADRGLLARDAVEVDELPALRLADRKSVV